MARSFQSLRMFGLAIMLGAALALPLPAPHGAVEVTPVHGGVALAARGATADQMLSRLADEMGFHLERAGKPAPAAPVTADLSGSPASLLQQLLGSQNHLIVYARAARNGIARIVLFSPASAGEQPVPVPSAPPAPEKCAAMPVRRMVPQPPGPLAQNSASARPPGWTGQPALR